MENKMVQIEKKLYKLVSTLYPICRSITGDGVRETLRIIQKIIPIKIHEVPSGTKVFDWEVPEEWNIKDAYVKTSSGERIIDFKKSNLHVLGYSVPVKKRVTIEELKEHIFTLEDLPDAIPYRTSYYNRNWGFCISYNQFKELNDKEYDVLIDSSFKKGYLTYGELFLRGRSKDEILISTHICHPSLCNDNLSGIAVATYLAKLVNDLKNREYSYRFLFIPGTIGSITWLAKNEDKIKDIKHGLVLSCLGDKGSFTYKKSRRGNATIDRAVEKALEDSKFGYEIRDFSPFGYDERQYCSPGINLPVGCLMRTPYGEFKEYHTSLDNLDFIDSKSLEESLQLCIRIFNILENNKTYINTNPKCEPHLGKRGLYKHIGGEGQKEKEKIILWILNLSDGTNDLLDIAIKGGINFCKAQDMCDVLIKKGLLKEKKKGI